MRAVRFGWVAWPVATLSVVTTVAAFVASGIRGARSRMTSGS